MKFSFLFALSSFLLLACSTTVKVPDNIIDQQTMVGILTDVHLIEGQLRQINVSQDSSAILYKAFEKKIFEKYGVSEAKYVESYRWYFNNLRAFEVVYGTVVDSLMVRQQTKKLFD